MNDDETPVLPLVDVDLRLNNGALEQAAFHALADELLPKVAELIGTASPHVGYVLVMQSGTAKIMGANVPPHVAGFMLTRAAAVATQKTVTSLEQAGKHPQH